MGHVLKGNGKIYQKYSLLYDLSFLSRQISFEVNITLEDNNKDKPPTILSSDIQTRLTKGRGKARPKGLIPRKLEFCYLPSGSLNSTYIPFSENNPLFLNSLKEIEGNRQSLGFQTLSYFSEKWNTDLIPQL